MRDDWFIRGKVPMTKSEVRAVALSKLELGEGSLLWDIGAGTGSVAIEALLCRPIKAAYAFEKKAEAVELICKNREKAGLRNLTVVEGDALEQIKRIADRRNKGESGDGEAAGGTPVATHAFIGGTSGNLEAVVELLLSLNGQMRIVINVIALESLALVTAMLKNRGIEAEIVQVQASRAVRTGSYHLMQGQNPVYIISFGGREPSSGHEKEGMPRIMFAAPGSGSGKTLLTCGFLQAVKQRGLHPCSFKCGPDYIDPMFHRYVLGIPGMNLDSFFLEEGAVKENFVRSAEKAGAGIAVIEGVMGYYDGVGGIDTRASAYDIARITETPVILVMDGKGASLSLAATVKGFAALRKDSRIEGIILNRTSPSVCGRLKERIEAETGIPVVGCLPDSPEYRFESRHLGLLMPGETKALQERIEKLAGQMEQTVDIGRILAIANQAKELLPSAPENDAGNRQAFFSAHTEEKVRIGIARDEAFCFYYHENLELLKEQGAELVCFSPIHDRNLPKGLDGLILGGGYPENYAEKLSSNEEMLQSIREAWLAGMPVLAECGGFLYLHEMLEGSDGSVYKMAGIYKQKAFNTGRLGRFGYISLTGPGGMKIKGHEFHYWESGDPGEDWLAEKPASDRSWHCIHQDGPRICGFPQFYYLSAPSFTEWWLEQCRLWRKKTI